MNNESEAIASLENFSTESQLTELYAAVNQMGALIEDLSRRLAELELDKINATAKVSKIFLSN